MRDSALAHGREAKVEARIGRREEKRAREESPEITKLPGGGNVMGGDDSFAAARARCDPKLKVFRV